jgi:hypothetical protein
MPSLHNRPVDKEQTGYVIRCGIKIRDGKSDPNSPVRKNDREGSIVVDYTGAHGDTHSGYTIGKMIHPIGRLQDGNRYNTRYNNIPEYFLESVRTNKDQGNVLVARGNISLISDICYKMFGSDDYGILGENITVSNIDLNILRENSFIKIGNEVVLWVKAEKTVCFKGYRELIGPDRLDYVTEVVSRFPDGAFAHKGILCTVVKPGTICNGDTVTTIVDDKLVGTELLPLPVARRYEHRTEFLTPEVYNKVIAGRWELLNELRT